MKVRAGLAVREGLRAWPPFIARPRGIGGDVLTHGVEKCPGDGGVTGGDGHLWWGRIRSHEGVGGAPVRNVCHATSVAVRDAGVN